MVASERWWNPGSPGSSRGALELKEELITVLLVDDHALVRRGFRLMLEDDPGIKVIAEANDGEEAVRLARKHRPKVVVMDCAMPKLGGMEATVKIREENPDIAVLVLSM